MEPTFWLERWQQGQIGFHQPQVNADLRQHWPRLACAAGSTVFVPLCGKSQDLHWLRSQGHEVVGIELAQLAVQTFFAEHALTPRCSRAARLDLWAAEGYRLYVGDFFDLDAATLGPVRAVYDRAALIALPPSLRRRYAQHLAALLAPGTRMLLVTMDYPQQQMPGPPFSVPEPEVHALYSQHFEITPLATRNALPAEPRFQERGLQSLHEASYLLERHQD